MPPIYLVEFFAAHLMVPVLMVQCHEVLPKLLQLQILPGMLTIAPFGKATRDLWFRQLNISHVSQRFLLRTYRFTFLDFCFFSFLVAI